VPEHGGTEPTKTPSSPAYPAGLTTREVEVLRLVAQGLTNRQIASELVISEHTAATHVRRILKKLDLHSRSQLAAWVHHGEI
jgi:DNA-binding NarL/FixJ family response regulator